MVSTQLTLWDIPVEDEKIQKLENELEALKKSHDNLRRGLFQRFDALKKELESLKEVPSTKIQGENHDPV